LDGINKTTLKECYQEYACEIFNIKRAIRFKGTLEQIGLLSRRCGDFQMEKIRKKIIKKGNYLYRRSTCFLRVLPDFLIIGAQKC